MAKDNRLKDLLSPETRLTEYYLIKAGLELALKELVLNGEIIELPDYLDIEVAKGIIEDLLKE